MKKYFHLLLAVLFILCTDCWGMDTKKKPTLTEIRKSLPIEEKNAVTDIIEKLNITIKDIETTGENKIRKLDLSGNHIKNLEPLVKLLEKIPHLFVLNLNSCEIENVTPLRALPLLKNLYLNNNHIKSTAGLENLTKLTLLDLSNNSVAIDFKGKYDLYKKNIKFFTYSVKQKTITRSEPKKLNPQLIKQKQIITLEPKKLEKNSAPKQVILKPKPIELKTKLINIATPKELKNLEDTQRSKKLTLNPSDKFITAEKKEAPQTNSSYMNLFNRYKNWVIGGLTVAAVGASAYLFNRLKKQKAID